VAAAPDHLDLARHRDMRGRSGAPWVRRAVLAVGAIPVALALAGVFGQRSETTAVNGPAAHLALDAPNTLRGGLLWRARIEVRAVRAVAHPRLLLGPGLVDGMQINTFVPQPMSDASRNGRFVASYPALAAGDSLVVYYGAQVDPTLFGRRDASVSLDDGTRELARVSRTITVLP